MRGGYFLVNCKGLDLTGGDTPQTIAGIWNKAEIAVNSGKPIVACNCKYGDADVSPVTCFGWYIAEDEIVIVGATLHIHIKDDDTLTVLDVTQ